MDGEQARHLLCNGLPLLEGFLMRACHPLSFRERTWNEMSLVIPFLA